MSPDPETGKYIMQNIIQTLFIGSLWLMALPTQATDISSQPPQAASESAAAQQDEWLTTYRDLFTNGKSAHDMEVFIATYKDTDPEKRVPRAMIRLRTFTAYEAAMKARQCKRAQTLHRRITGYKVTLPFSYAACKQGPTAQPTDPAQLYIAGVRFEDEGEYANARTLFRAILDRAPRHPIAIQAAERLARMAEIEQLGSSGKQTPPVKPTTALSSPIQPAIPAVRRKAAACPKNLEYIRKNMVFVELRNNPSFAEPIEGIIRKAGGLDAAIAELERLILENQRSMKQAQFTLKQYKRADDQTDNQAFRCAQPKGDFCSANYFYHLLKEGNFYYAELLNSLHCRKTGGMTHAVYVPAPIKRP